MTLCQHCVTDVVFHGINARALAHKRESLKSSNLMGSLRIVSSIWRRERCVSTSASPVCRRLRRTFHSRSQIRAPAATAKQPFNKSILSRTSSASGIFAVKRRRVFEGRQFLPTSRTLALLASASQSLLCSMLFELHVVFELAADHVVDIGSVSVSSTRGNRSS